MFSQIYKTLPRTAWNNVIIEESGEELVEVFETEKLKRSTIEKNYQPQYFVRKLVAEKLNQVAESLPNHINLILIEGYRSLKDQEYLWNSELENLKLLHPDWTVEQIDQQVRLVIARPHPLANHHCGGAVDVTLANSDGTLLDMGSPYPDHGYDLSIQKKYPMHSNLLSDEQGINRATLRNLMSSVGFVYYPGEWWHYCYGDRMWAVYTEQEKCLYGPIELSTYD